MLPVVMYPSQEAKEFFLKVTGRQVDADPQVERQVQEILARVREEGDSALVDFTRRFDAPQFTEDLLDVPAEEIDKAYEAVDPVLLGDIRRARDNIAAFHQRQIQRSWFEPSDGGVFLGQMSRPVASAGVYVPGGKGGETPLVSTVLMTAVPAAIAGVRDIAMATPPGRDGSVNPYLLVAAREAGVTRIHRMGSAWAIAALAYGTARVKPVHVIVGPGNIYVATAKRMVYGRVGIDSLAGPSEVVVVADEGADPDFVAADLLSQAEHDPLASAVCITHHGALVEHLQKALAHQLETLPRRETARQALSRYGAIIKTVSLEEAVHVANLLAPEHLELMVAKPWELLPRVKHAGAVFLGPYSPEAVGDYYAGPNHVLPTSGTARFASALGVDTFLKRTSVISYSKEAFERDADAVVRLAGLERLDAHARSVSIRRDKLRRPM
ncbi:histidinol dehydrogenase [Desulfacinum hydrothermale DSM 13146]|uniref:Histidinol dehydrogenase n=1 Tax=Desulfacinum hydrothermale DSM 13146 TaxID=1121390 RepID=A0A1W1X5I2_9BACT|nr:histidinol dehydrogenase [Desulfacinum hydrothermale]SMC19175.1 histidinol dehydrogenase [Desulfacinum hydrothermale DSM 13146]